MYELFFAKYSIFGGNGISLIKRFSRFLSKNLINYPYASNPEPRIIIFLVLYSRIIDKAMILDSNSSSHISN